MNAKISDFLICVEAITCLLLYNLHGCTLNIVRKAVQVYDFQSDKI